MLEVVSLRIVIIKVYDNMISVGRIRIHKGESDREKREIF